MRLALLQTTKLRSDNIQYINSVSSACFLLEEGVVHSMVEEFIDLQRSLYPDLAAKYEVLGSLYSSK